MDPHGLLSARARSVSVTIRVNQRKADAYMMKRAILRVSDGNAVAGFAKRLGAKRVPLLEYMHMCSDIGSRGMQTWRTGEMERI